MTYARCHSARACERPMSATINPQTHRVFNIGDRIDSSPVSRSETDHSYTQTNRQGCMSIRKVFVALVCAARDRADFATILFYFAPRRNSDQRRDLRVCLRGLA